MVIIRSKLARGRPIKVARTRHPIAQSTWNLATHNGWTRAPAERERSSRHLERIVTLAVSNGGYLLRAAAQVQCMKLLKEIRFYRESFQISKDSQQHLE